MMTKTASYGALAQFYFFYFALLGALVPYWSLYLKAHGLDALSIGLLMSLLQLSRIVSPMLWGWLAVYSGQPVKILRTGALLMGLVFVAIFWQKSALEIGFVMLGFSFFWHGILPQFEALTLRTLADNKEGYSRIRLWGSIGFIVAVSAIGAVLDWLSIHWLPVVLLVLMLAIWLSTLCVSEPVKSSADINPVAQERFLALLLRPQVVVFFLICLLVEFSHGAYYTFFSVLLEEVGYSRAQIGGLWALGVIAEIVLFVFMHRLIQRYSLRLIMVVSLVLCVIRWLIIGISPDNLVFMLFAQLLHAATFGALHAVAMGLIQHYFSTPTYTQGQAFYYAASLGVGGMLGAFISGLLWDFMGPFATFAMSSLASFIAILLALYWIHPSRLQQKK